MPLIVNKELAREGIQVAAVDWWTGRYGTRVERFVGITTVDLARFLAWAEGAGVSVGEARSEEGSAPVAAHGNTLTFGWLSAVPA